MREDPHLSRRQLLGLLGAAGAWGLARNTGAEAGAPRPGRPVGMDGWATGLDCVVTPAQTEGPYFVDERLNRADIRRDPSDGTVSEGAPVKLAIKVSQVVAAACAPVVGAMVDLWQCDALGIYSDVLDPNGFFDTRGRKFLRGYQLTDRSGTAEFLTLYPGWYTGRTVHIHFKVRVFDGDLRAQEFTSQLYFDDALTDQVFERPPYNTRGPRSTRNERDGIYRSRNSGDALLLRLERDGAGYRGVTSVGLRMS